MKKALLIVSMFAILLAVACTSRTNSNQAVQPAPIDTTGLAAFQDWKFQNELKDASEYMQETAAVPVKTVKKKVAVKKPKPVVVTPAPEQTEKDNSTVNETPSQDQNGTMGTETTNEAKEKKGISNTVKGTVIGAVSGAVLGAVINKKNRVVGGILGGVLGGGVGFGIGKTIDKKQGR